MTDDTDGSDAGSDVPSDSATAADGETPPDDGAAPPETNGQSADGGTEEAAEEEYGDETVPHVELELYELGVRVSGQSTDGLEDVESSAKRLMEFLIDNAKRLEDEPDTRGLS